MRKNLILPVLACFFAALTTVGAYIALPFPGSPVPIVLQNLFIMLSALLLGPTWSLVSVLIYLALGALGLPVFAGGTGGFARFMGPTGGYLVGYIPGVLAMGAISRAGARRPWKDAAAIVVGMSIVYACGLLWLKNAINADWPKALAVGLLPFVPGDILKTAVAAISAPRLRRILDRSLDAISANAENADERPEV